MVVPAGKRSKSEHAKHKNSRSLGEIAGAIHALERNNIFDIGDLLLEARGHPEHGEHGRWLAWLDTEFEWSIDTAQNYMKAAGLAAKFRNFRNLKLAKCTVYKLANHNPEDELPTIITELAKHAAEKRLPPRDAERVIKTGRYRHRFGDCSDATLTALVELDGFGDWRRAAFDAVLSRNPVTREEADAIIDSVRNTADDDQGDEEDKEDREPAPSLTDLAPFAHHDAQRIALITPAPREPLRQISEADLREAHVAGGAGRIVDALVHNSRPGMRQNAVELVFSERERDLDAFVQAVRELNAEIDRAYAKRRRSRMQLIEDTSTT